MPLKIPLEDAAVSIINIHAQSHTHVQSSVFTLGGLEARGAHITKHTHKYSYTRDDALTPTGEGGDCVPLGCKLREGGIKK